MKKKYIILIFLLISLFIFFSNLESIRPVVTKYLSTEAKIKIKELIFGKKRMKIIHEYTNMNYNQTLLPETQFTNINLKEIPLHNFTRKKEDGYINSKNSDISAKFFLGQFNDDLVIVDEIGRIFFINMQFIPDFKDFNWVRVNSNLNSPDIKIKDILLSNNEIYISYSETTSEKCSTINISKAKILKKELNFKIFFKSEECKMAFNAGRMVFYNHEDRDGLLLTTSANYGLKNLAQDDNSVFGKIYL